MKAAIIECLRVLRTHRSRFVIVALVSAFAALVLWLSSPRSIESSDDSLRLAAERARQQRAPDAPVTASVEPAVADPSPVASGAVVEKVEVCGVGWVDTDADGVVDMQSLLASLPMAEASAQLLESVRGDGDFGAATALALQLASPGDGTVSPLGIELACGAGPCDATSQQRAAAASLFDQMVRLASATNDPRAYSLALDLCMRRPGDGACAALNGAQWARLDPDNGEPWLHLLGQAFAHRDESAVDDALFHIGAAPRIDGHLFAESKLVTQHAGPAPAQLLVAGELSMTAGVIRAGSFNGFGAVYRSCSYGALADPNRKELCEKVAAALQDRSSSLMSMRIGSSIGRRLGWADERFANADAIMAAASDAVPLAPKPFDESLPAASVRQPLDCASVGKVFRYFGEVATLGEREHIRRWIERSGRADHYLQLGRAQHASTVASEAADAARRASEPGR